MPTTRDWNPPPKLEEPLTITSCDSPTQALELMDALQFIAWQHAEMFGLDYDRLHIVGRMWVLTRLYFRVLEPLPKEKKLTLRTWPVGFDKRTAWRDFILLDGDHRLAEATSSWAILEEDTREMVPMDNILADRMPGDLIPRNLEFPSRTLPRLKQPEADVRVQVTEEDIDLNGHVNNLHYLNWAVQSLPAEVRGEQRLAAADLIFRAECFAGDELVVGFAPLKPAEFVYLHSLIRSSDNREVARVQTTWRD